jgi:hypothetical protein
MKTTILDTQRENINIPIIIFPETLKYCTAEQNCRWIKIIQSLHQNSIQINQICNQNISRKIKRKIFFSSHFGPAAPAAPASKTRALRAHPHAQAATWAWARNVHSRSRPPGPHLGPFAPSRWMKSDGYTMNSEEQNPHQMATGEP